jgi:hypothetical protein
VLNCSTAKACADKKQLAINTNKNRRIATSSAEFRWSHEILLEDFDPLLDGLLQLQRTQHLGEE